MSVPWSARAHEAMCELWETGEPFSSDNLKDIVGVPDQGHEPNGTNNQIGSVFREWSARGLIERVDTTRSTYRHRKGGLIVVWQRVPGS